ncbi:MAG: SGNH/GDSL hydrolase family protein [Bdellovibrionales bacterium]
MSYKVITALGDSITNGYWDEEGYGGWFGRLQRQIVLAHPHEFGFNNLGHDGDDTASVLQRLRTEVVTRPTDILLVASGINDLIRWESRETPLEITAEARMETWQSLLKTAKDIAPRVAVLSILPVVDGRFPNDGGEGRPLYYCNSDIEPYNAFLKRLCSDHDVAFVDIYPALANTAWPDHVYDGTHPNARGHQVVADLVFRDLNKLGWLA